MKRLFAVLNVILFLGCHSSSKLSHQSSVKLDVTPAADLSKTTLKGNNILIITYHWKTGKDFKPVPEELIAKVHFINKHHKIFFQDDHRIDPSPDHWKPDSEYTYRRVVYVPLIPAHRELIMVMGLYHPGSNKQYFLNGNCFDKDWYITGNIEVKVPTRPEDLPNANVRFTEGWYPEEHETLTKKKWRWMEKEAVCILKNPGHDANLFIKCWIPSDIYKSSSQLTLLLDGKEFKHWKNLSDEVQFLVPFPQTLFHGKQTVELKLISDHDYVPEKQNLGQDTRHLSIMFREFYFN